MFSNVSAKIIERIKNTCNIDTTELDKIKDITEEEILSIEILADKKTEILSFGAEDFHLIQFPIGNSQMGCFHATLKSLSKQINHGLVHKKNFIYAYKDEKLKIETLKKDKAYVFKIPSGSMDRVQVNSAIRYYNDELASKINEHGYNVTFTSE